VQRGTAFNAHMDCLRTCILAATLGASLACSACAHDPATGSTAQYSGQRLFEVYCSNCHGADGSGHGPAEPYVTGHPPDLTRISVRNGGAFPAERVFRTIDGQFDSPGPGERHMPVWGYDFFSGEGDDETAHQQVLDVEHRLVKYVESIQER